MRDALTTRTGLLLGAATVLLAVTSLGLTIGARPPPPEPEDYMCVMPSRYSRELRTSIHVEQVVNMTQPELARLPQECSLYVTGLRQLAQSSCPAFPADARDSILQAVDQMVQAWQTMPEESTEMLAGVCREGHHAIRDALTQLCPQAQLVTR